LILVVKTKAGHLKVHTMVVHLKVHTTVVPLKVHTTVVPLKVHIMVAHLKVHITVAHLVHTKVHIQVHDKTKQVLIKGQAEVYVLIVSDLLVIILVRIQIV
jgi:hypothetical protein